MVQIYKGTSDATMDVSYSTTVDSTSFTNLISTTELTFDGAEQKYNKIVPISTLQNVNWYRMKFAGTGQVSVNYLQKNVRVKGGGY